MNAIVVLSIIGLLLLTGCAVEATEKEVYHNPLVETCTRGMSDDPYPGTCGQYIDLNEDGLCDRGQPAEI